MTNEIKVGTKLLIKDQVYKVIYIGKCPTLKPSPLFVHLSNINKITDNKYWIRLDYLRYDTILH